MSVCTVTTGFFVLRRCGAVAVTGCARCRRPLCAAHVANAGLCPECDAVTSRPGDLTRLTAAARFRRSFYADSAGRFSDPGWYGMLDEFDRSAFAPGAGHGAHDGHGGHHHGGHGDHGDYDDGTGYLDS